MAKISKTPKAVYLVVGTTGVGGDTETWCVGAFVSGDDALAFARRANEWLKEHKALRWVGTERLKISHERRLEIVNARPQWLPELKVDYNGACFDVSEPVTLHAESPRKEETMAETYKIVRYYQDPTLPPRLVQRGLSLADAQKHCKNPETSSRTATSAAAKARTRRKGDWFEGYTKEK